MNERIKELAEQAHEFAKWACEVDLRANYSIVRDERFAELIRADEREAIIDICEGVEVFDETMRTVTEAIRQRGER